MRDNTRINRKIFLFISIPLKFWDDFFGIFGVIDSYSGNETGIEATRYHKSNDFRIVKGYTRHAIR